MKKVKIVFWLLLLAVLGVIVYQNWAELRKPLVFQLNTWVAGNYETPEAALVVILAGSFLLGLLIAYSYSLYGNFKQNKTIKHLNTTVASQTEEIETLRRKVKDLERPVAAEIGQNRAPSTVDA